MAAAGQVCLRNRHPMRSFAVPLGNGWARIVPPQSCTTVSLRVLHLAPVVAGLAAEQLAIVTEVAQYWIGKSHCPRHCSVCCQQSLRLSQKVRPARHRAPCTGASATTSPRLCSKPYNANAG